MAKKDAARARARSLSRVLTGTRRTRVDFWTAPLEVTLPSRAIDTRNGALLPPVRPYAKDAWAVPRLAATAGSVSTSASTRTGRTRVIYLRVPAGGPPSNRRASRGSRSPHRVLGSLPGVLVVHHRVGEAPGGDRVGRLDQLVLRRGDVRRVARGGDRIGECILGEDPIGVLELVDHA